jgi:hypothetical protein
MAAPDLDLEKPAGNGFAKFVRKFARGIAEHPTTIAGPGPGQQIFYSLVTLIGTAEAAVF